MVDCINTVISSIFHKISHKYLFSVAEYLFWYKPSENGANDNILPIHGNMPEIANGLSEAMVQRTESISILSVIWLAGLLLCFGFFCGFLYKMLSGISIFAACWKWYFGSMEGKTSTKKESIHPADRNHSCTTFLWCDSPSYFNAKKYRMENIYQLRYVLEHEYVHIRRLDMLTSW